VELHVFGLVDDTHPSAAKFIDDAIVRDGLADHGLNLRTVDRPSQRRRAD